MKKNKLYGMMFLIVGIMLAFTTCGGGKSEFNIWFHTGEGGGTPPEGKLVKSGETITLPGQGNMIAPAGKDFSGWYEYNDEYDGRMEYAAGESTTVFSDRTFGADWKAKKYSQAGIYISLMSFAGDAEIIGGGDNNKGYNNNWQDSGNDFILLNNSGKSYFSSILQSYNRANAPGTALFYAVHKALANLTANADQFLADISSVNIITFTDGLDNASFGASNRAPIEGKSGVTRDDYAAYLNSEIGSRKINGMPITAHSVGIKGSDVEDEAQFTENLENIASAPENVKQLTDFDELGIVFSEIAENLRFESTFSMTTTQNDPGTIIRMTFDVTGTTSMDAAESTKYIEGTLAYSNSDGVWTLTNITYGGGITSDTSSGGSITGTVFDSSNVTFLFRNISGHDDAAAPIQQWTKPSAGSTNWQRNSEYNAAGSISVSGSTAIIQLVLDASTSLDPSQVEQIRAAVNSFIDTLDTRIRN